jgi:ATP-dependent DNA ligase
LVVFDLLVAADSRSLVELNFDERRARLEYFFVKTLAADPIFQLSPSTARLTDTEKWLKITGAALDGIIAKRADLPYQSGTRDGMVKIKNLRSADCVIGGFRYAATGRALGSLLLGLYDDRGLLHHVGFTSSFSSDQKKALLNKRERRIAAPGFTGNAPGGPSRWSSKRSNEWQPLRPDLVVEVQYDHFTGKRFRHGAKFLRWRPDKAPKTCSMDQVKARNRASRAQLLPRARRR